jgi:hypothetical protein
MDFIPQVDAPNKTTSTENTTATTSDKHICCKDGELARAVVLQPQKPLPQSISQAATVEGYDFNQGIQWELIMDSYLRTGFQASHLGMAIQVCVLDKCKRTENFE